MIRLYLASIPVLALAFSSTGLDASAWTRARCGPADITTQWSDLVDPAHVLPEHPRPQLVRGPTTQGAGSSFVTLNGLWEFELAPPSGAAAPPFGRHLSGAILVPFPPESCLSGVGAFESWPKSTPDFSNLFYRLLFDGDPLADGPPASTDRILHFGAVDWQCRVWLNGILLGSHTGGYDAFSFVIPTGALKTVGNELILYAFDPTENGFQPEGKQRIAAILSPGGDHYAPSSGIWGTVWMEAAPPARFERVVIDTSLTSITLNTTSVGAPPGTRISAAVTLAGEAVASGSGMTGTPLAIAIPSPQLWSPDSPTLYDIVLTLGNGGDSVTT